MLNILLGMGMSGDYPVESTPAVDSFAIMSAFTIPILLINVLFLIVYWRLFTKAGEDGWKSIIPIYNIVVFLKIAGKPWYWLFLLCIPGVNLVFSILATISFLKAFGKEGAGSVILALLFTIFYFPYLAFSSDVKYVGV